MPSAADVTPLAISLVRPAGSWRPSMSRFADALSTGLSGEFVLNSVPPLADRKWPRQLLSNHPGLSAMLQRTRTDVFHLVDHSYAHLCRVLPSERTVVTCHDLILLAAAADDRLPRPKRRSVSRFRWTIGHLPRAAAVVCVSGATREALANVCPISPERLHVVPQGVDPCFRRLEVEPGRLRDRLGIHSSYVVCHISSGWAYKNVGATLRVVAALRTGGLDVTLLRAGSRLTAEELALAERLGLAGSVVDSGIVTDDRLAEIYNASDVLLFPSFHEGFGWPVLEAMACGTPVVTSDCPALLEVAGTAGLHAPAHDASALTSCVAQLLGDHGEKKHKSQLGLARSAQFTWARTVESYGRIYRSVAEPASLHTGTG